MPGTGQRQAVFAVVVTHRPLMTALEALLRALRPQVGGLVVVDNASPDPGDALPTLARAHAAALIANPRNLGVAAGLNQGIERARAEGARAVLLMDQDSLPAPDLVATLADALERLGQSAPVAAVGPVAEDLRDGGEAPFVRIGFPFNRKRHAMRGETVRCDFLITSGARVPVEALDAVGPMDEGLFIDNVDLDWSFRAARAGRAQHGVGAARMGHRIGEGIRRLPLGASFVHPPPRLYYMMRNRVLLYWRASTPWKWIAQDVPRAALKLLRFSLLVAPRRANARAMLRGLRDGILGKDGPMSEG